MFWNVGYILFIEPKDVTDWSAKYFLWCIGGLFSGTGLATFPLITNTLYWSQPKDAGKNQGIFGGLGNISPGLFLIVIVGILTALDSNSNKLKILFVVWLIF